ncbi:cation-transporting P-type ATPase, partial [Rhizobium johnstonii]|uniref:cation-transporting P-type ATPase n=1 Tax=Rhizobium johnstonii TaxID=3019933 RepID=UPI003F9CFEEE
MTDLQQRPTEATWFTQDPDQVVAALGSDAVNGLTEKRAAELLAEHGPNQIASEPQPSVWAVAFQQVIDPMNIMLVIVAIISFLIGQAPVG